MCRCSCCPVCTGIQADCTLTWDSLQHGDFLFGYFLACLKLFVVCSLTLMSLSEYDFMMRKQDTLKLHCSGVIPCLTKSAKCFQAVM